MPDEIATHSPRTPGADRPNRLAYLTLQATEEGQASFAHVHEIVGGLRARGWRVELFEARFRGERRPGAAARVLEFLRVQARLWRGLVRAPDAVYVRAHFAALPTALLARMRGILVVQEVNGPYEDLFIAWPWTRRMRRWFVAAMRAQLRWADAVVVVTEPYREWVRSEVGEKRIEVIPNAANTELFRPGAEPPRTVPARYALFFGALAPWQGIETMLGAVTSPGWPNDVSLVIVGDGAERPRVEAAAAADPRVVYLGKLPYREIPGVIGGALVSLSPQTDLRGRARLGLYPLKVFESLACGAPVIVTDFPGQAELVSKGDCGWVIPSGDPAALADAVRECVNDVAGSRAKAARGLRLVVREHSWDARARATDALLKTLVEE